MPQASSSSRILDLSVRQRMPYPVAAAWHRVSLALTPGARLERLLAVPPALVRLVTFAQLVDYRRGPRDEAVERSLAHLARPSEGHWLQLLRALTGALRRREEPRPFMPEAGDWLLVPRDRPSDASRALERFVALRNELRHGAPPVSGVDEEARHDEVLALVREVLESASWLEGYRPFRVLDQEPTPTQGEFTGRVQLFAGSLELVEPERASWRAWLLPARVTLASPDGSRFLVLHPLVQVLADARRKRELFFELVASPRLRGLRLAHFGAGEELDVDVDPDRPDVTFEQWLARVDPDTVVENAGEAGVFGLRDLATQEAETTVLADRYEVRGVLGRGGMAVVYRVWDRVLEASFALKVLDAELSADRRFRERFRREAQLMARLHHPHLLGASDFGELPDGRLFLKMPVAEGGSLRELIGGDIPEETVAAWARQALAALAALHQAGVVHRDVKPGNLLLDGRGGILLADLGIAFDRSGARLTQTFERLGSLEYMAPEQRGKGSGAEPVDLYALGVVLHELLTGQLPDGAPGLDLGGDLGALARRIGALDPAERPTAAEALVLLGGPATTEGALDPRRGPPRAVGESRPRRVRALGVAVALAVVGLALTLFVLRSEGPSTTTSTDPAGLPPSHTPVAERPGVDGMSLVLVPGAELGLGLSRDELGRHRAVCDQVGSTRCRRQGYFDRETPEVSVTLGSFYLDRYEVSRHQYATCVSAGACEAPDEAACPPLIEVEGAPGSEGSGVPAQAAPELPRTCVNRADAATYCAWVERRLPTEAEWELAAAGPEGRVFAWGDVFEASRTRFDNSLPPALTAVDALPDGATPLGVFQLTGNAYEWVADDACDYEVHPGGRDPVCRATAERGIIRGGSYASDAGSLRTTYRRFLASDARVHNVGFRCASDAE